MPHATRPGDVLADRYRLVDLLSESGDGRFWRAHDRVLERHVAIHVIRADDPRAPGLMAAARRSATVLDRRILRVLDADVTEEVCYVVNEWGWGTSLDILATGTGPLGPRRSAWLVAEVADSIATAHRSGIAHGRLNPENVLIDRTGGVRIIGLCVDAALHGVPGDDPTRDLTDLAGLLYCALTATWGGESGSIVRPAPRDHGEVLRPRRVRAGIPRPLDSLCDQLLHPDAVGRHRDLESFAPTARGIADFLSDFVGDPTGMAVALLASTPPVLPDEELVVLPQVPEMTPHESARSSAPRPPAPPIEPDEPDPLDVTDVTDVTDLTERAAPDRPTEAGLPIFGEDGDDVSWLERRATPAPPPPPFEEPPERPLFAPEPSDGGPARKARASATPASGVRPRDEYWPWDTGHGVATTSSTTLPPVEDDAVPGRRSFRVGAVLAVLVLVSVAVVVALSLGRGQGSPDDDPSPTSAGTGSGRTAATEGFGSPVEGVVATAFDPLGTDGGENDDDAPNAVDGDPQTVWTTQGYNDQLGPPPGLKTGVGLLLDLGASRPVTGIDLTLVGAPTSVSVYVSAEAPDGVAGLQPVADTVADGPTTSLDLEAGVPGRYVVVWLTAVPADGSVFRGTVAEAVVRAAVDE